MNPIEQIAFEAWFDYPGTVHPTGWKVWLASLAYRGVPEDVARDSRPAFDLWLNQDSEKDWTEFDAWAAAAD